MGRGVETVSDSEQIYFDAGDFYDEVDGCFDYLIDNLQVELIAKYKSFNAVQDSACYPYRETLIILENDHCNISISEYCGCGVVCIFKSFNCEVPELAEHWIEQNIDGIRNIISQYVTELRKLGTFSNGCSVFEKAGTTDKYGRSWNLPANEICFNCGQPDNSGDCDHSKLSDDEVKLLQA